MNYVRFGSINWIHIRIIRIRHVDGHAVCMHASDPAKKRSSAKHKKKSERGKDEEAWRDTEQ